jgi:inosine-uridine nucleoside N-ribohydrolase
MRTVDSASNDDTMPAIFDMDIGSDPDDTCVAAMVLMSIERFTPALLVTNDETVELGRARFLSGLVATAGVDIPVAAGLPSKRLRARCLVEETDLCPADGDFERDGVQAIVRVLETYPRVRYFGLGALTNLDAALSSRPALAPRVDLVQMGPALVGAYDRTLPQYNARLDPGAFVRVLARVRDPTLVFSHSTWGRYGAAMRQRLGIYPDDPFAEALRNAVPLTALWFRHLEAWVQTGKPCSIMHDPLTVLSSLRSDLVDFADVGIVLSDDGWACLDEQSHRELRTSLPGRGSALAAHLSGPPRTRMGTGVRCRMSLDTDDELARSAIATALLGERGIHVASSWGTFNRTRTEDHPLNLTERT